ncbi:MAG: glycosyltransferase [Wenzhouxiangellaceae bacterium]|nr:glycosyltransferase [Wenzhouxiangellaceae bacterium]
MSWLAGAAACLWLAVLLVPWRPWSTRERLEPAASPSGRPRCDAAAVTVLIPARNEADSIAATLEAVALQAGVAAVVVVDDGSEDGSGEIVASWSASNPAVRLVEGRATPPGWSGKLWALEQGLGHVDTPLVLLLDADIRLDPGMVAALTGKLEHDRLDQVSIMAELPAESLPEKLMLPAFVYFFRQIYPFAWVNRPDRPFAAAAGGCVLVRREMLERAGAFAAWKNALIDDCELARRVRAAGGRIWLGLSHGVRSMRRHPDFGSVLATIRRTAYVQLRQSPALLALTVAVMLLAFIAPPAAFATGIVEGSRALSGLGLAGWLLMAAGYAPQVRFAGLSVLWAASLPLAAMLFLAATVDSAARHHFGAGAGWKGRRYTR